MDEQLGSLMGDSSYHQIYNDYLRFEFGILSDILFSKYYHKDYPYTKKQRNKAVKELLSTEPFSTAIKRCQYNELGTEAKIKKFMLTHGLTTLFCEMRKIKKKAQGQVSQ